MTKIISSSLANKMMKDRLVRTSITKDSFLYFFNFYYAHYVKYETADFQKEIFHYLEKSSTENLYIVAFRGSGKSTMVTTAYPIWAILGKQQKKFCLIVCQTKAQETREETPIEKKKEVKLSTPTIEEISPQKTEKISLGKKQEIKEEVTKTYKTRQGVIYFFLGFCILLVVLIALKRL
jgi:hypothetical protein